MKEILLTAIDVIKNFQHSSDLVLNHINAEIQKSDFTIIMGPSGAGKSTLLYALSGMDGISGGVVAYKGQDLSRLSEKQMAELRVKEFGFVFQQTHLVSNLTLFENVAVAGYLDKTQPEEETAKRAEALLIRMNVENAKDRMPAQTSGGEAQRAALARAMINQPRLLFADEPTGALNKKNSEEVLNLLTELNREGQSILMVTHDIRAAFRGNRILYLEDGKIIAELSLPPFEEENARKREEKISTWLSSLSW